MMRSLYSGVTGLTTHQTRMDVIGNNIANVNTYGFKSSRTTFKDIYYQTVKSPSAGMTREKAGNNPTEVGYGVQLGSIDKNMSRSSFAGTDRTFDLAISGEGFFIVGKPDQDSDDMVDITYTRMGNFGLDSAGNLVNANNKFVLGTKNAGDFSGSTISKIDPKSEPAQLSTLNVNRLIKTAFNVFTDADGFMYGYNFNKILGIDDSGAPGTPDTNTYVGDSTYSLEEYNALTDNDEKIAYLYAHLDIDKTLEKVDALTTGLADYKYYCNKSGQKLVGKDGNSTDYGSLTDDNAKKTAMANGSVMEGTLDFKDLEAFSIGSDGVLNATYKGEIKALARIEIAVFDNPEGLLQAGNTDFMISAASGDAGIRKPGDPGAGTTESGKLEMSNVNLAQEFSDMIITQRGFQANSRIITTSDSMLEELVNLKR